MLVLTRRQQENIYLDFSGMSNAELLALRAAPPIKIAVVETRSDRVKLGFEAPEPVKIDRKEVFEKKHLAGNAGSQPQI